MNILAHGTNQFEGYLLKYCLVPFPDDYSISATDFPVPVHQIDNIP